MPRLTRTARSRLQTFANVSRVQSDEQAYGLEMMMSETLEEKFAQELAEDWLVVNGICERRQAKANKYALVRQAYMDGYFRYAEVHDARAEVERLRKDAEPCHWMQDGEGNYWTDCGQGHTFIDGGPTENSMTFCCYCGKTLEAAKEPT